MKIKYRKEQQSKGMMSKTVSFKLHAQAELMPEEKAAVDKYKLSNINLYYSEKQVGSGEGFFSAVATAMASLNVTVGSLIAGQTIEAKDITEVMYAQQEINKAGATFKRILDAAMNFDGEEIVEFPGEDEA